MPINDRNDINAELVTRLIAQQFPEWADLPVRRVELDGWDNRTFRLGEELSVRLPSAAGYVAQVEKEHRWLPRLASQLPLPIPAPVAMGRPTDEYQWPWSVYRWLPGEPAATGQIIDLTEFATDLAKFLTALYEVDPEDGPIAGPHSFYRGGRLSVYAAEVRDPLKTLAGQIDIRTVRAIWDEALAAEWTGSPVWVHGDVAVGNLLVEDGRLSAVIDFGCSAVGDPACDTVIAWTLFSGESRRVFRELMPVDTDTWVRGRGWALWKALIMITGTDSSQVAGALRVLDEILADYRSGR